MNIKEKRIVYMGTPVFSTYVLKGLIKEGYNVVAIVSQPDKEVGRKRLLEPTPVKKVGIEFNIPVYQPVKLKNECQFLIDLKPDLIITCAYGQIVPTTILELPKHGCLNVHGSLLPKLRGGAPIQRCIMNGDKKTGITLMQMIDKMDAGDMYLQKEIEIGENENYGSLHDRLAILGRDMLLDFLPLYLTNNYRKVSQNEREVTYGYNIKREDEIIDFNKSVNDIHNLIRALDPQTGAHCNFNGTDLKIWKAHIVNFESDSDVPGTIVNASKTGIIVKCKDGYLSLDELQLQGKKRMYYKDFLNGYKDNLVNEVLK